MALHKRQSPGPVLVGLCHSKAAVGGTWVASHGYQDSSNPAASVSEKTGLQAGTTVYIHTYVHMFVVYMCMFVQMSWHHIWMSADSLQKRILLPCDSGNQTQIVRLSSKLLNLLNHLTGPDSRDF